MFFFKIKKEKLNEFSFFGNEFFDEFKKEI